MRPTPQNLKEGGGREVGRAHVEGIRPGMPPFSARKTGRRTEMARRPNSSTPLFDLSSRRAKSASRRKLRHAPRARRPRRPHLFPEKRGGACIRERRGGTQGGVQTELTGAIFSRAREGSKCGLVRRVSEREGAPQRRKSDECDWGRTATRARSGRGGRGATVVCVPLGVGMAIGARGRREG
jgi:hypothetical protein